MNAKRILATIMFTDMVGYTALMQEDEPLARRKRDRHRSVLEERHALYNGRIIQYFGDGTLSIFDSSVNAVQCALDMQQQLKAPIEVPLRIGLHTGDIVLEADNVIGDAVNLASRIESFSVPGAVLFSDTVYEQIKNQPQFRFQHLGEFHLKNVERPFALYALANDGLHVPEPDSLTGKGQRMEAANNNLPRVNTSFLGREKEISEVKALLQEHRLITLTGPGGTGKTRLSLQIARDVTTGFPDGIFWAALASVREPEAVSFAIAKELGLQEDTLLSIEEVLVRFFRDKRALLVLDNFEQIVGAAPVVEKLFLSCGQLYILVSSRIVLQIRGEQEYPVSPLHVPPPNSSHDPKDLQQIASVALFVQRARSHRPNFQLTPDNGQAIAEICIRLDGLPLAIELAAARTKIFTPEALLRRLNDKLEVLRGGGKFPERHQTLRQTIAWSYDLLDPEERELFRRISVFVGGSTMEALEKVCGQNGLAEATIIDGVMALVDKSLLQTEETADELRFYMLETIREFAGEELEKSQQSAALKKAHIQYFLSLAEAAAPHFYSSEGHIWTPRLLSEQANLRAAIDYALELGEMRTAYRLALNLRVFWSNIGRLKEGLLLLEKVASAPVPDDLQTERLKIYQALGMLYLMDLQSEKAIPLLEENLRYWRTQDNPQQLGLALNDLGWGYLWVGRFQEGEAYSHEARILFEELQDQSRLIASLNNISSSYEIRGIPDKSNFYLRQLFALTDAIGDRRRGNMGRIRLADLFSQQGRYAQAERQIEACIEECREYAYTNNEVMASALLAGVRYGTGDFPDCLALTRDIEKKAREGGFSWAFQVLFSLRAFVAFGQNDLEQARQWSQQAEAIGGNNRGWSMPIGCLQARIAIRTGQLSQAKSYCAQLLAEEFAQGSYMGFLPGLETAAIIAALEHNYTIAAQLFFNAQAIRAELGTPIIQSERYLYDPLLADLEDHLEQEAYRLAKENRIADQQLLALAMLVLEA